ncbi:hypothetical protein ILUMI_09278 [Ignelater luminosus]|uniref:Signal transducing adapter molecule 1 n=1 Tax=Ignelater luminosus TaxID=2038154 RepID=A0A8K0D458_IGNLU|nr:hypothetical protein ILUMI_09278 [Ignelater luminosus]
MGLFGSTSPFDSDVEKATSEKNTSEQWGLILDVCDKASKSSEDAKGYLRSIFKRLNSPDPHIAIQAATLLDACVSNCGKTFHIEIASREFENEYCKLIKKCHPKVAQKLKESLKKWAEGEFKTDQQLNLIPSLYVKLKNSGIDFTAEMPVKKTVTLSKDPNVVQSQEEEDQIAKAIELSLKETSGSPRNSGATASSLYPTNLGATGLTMSGSSGTSSAMQPAKESRKVRALYDFEAAEDNELTFTAGEIIVVIDDSDPNWWKGSNQRGEGLFPANFVTADLSVEPEQLTKKMVQFKETEVKEEKEPEEVEINEGKIDRLIHLLHEADPTNPEQDSDEMLKLEREVNGMGPLIDTELERVDRKHAQLTQLSSDLVEALSLYHTLMREPQYAPVNKMPYGYQNNVPSVSVIYNGNMPPPPFMGQPYNIPGANTQDRQFLPQQIPQHIQLPPPGLPPPGHMPPGSLPQNILPPGLPPGQTVLPGSRISLPNFPPQAPQGMPNYGPQNIPSGYPPVGAHPITQIGGHSNGTPGTQSGHFPTTSNTHIM